jgi:hypothetical protein
MRRLLPWATGISLALTFIVPAPIGLLRMLFPYPALAVAIFRKCFPLAVGGTQDLFLRILIGPGVALASGIGAGLITLFTCASSLGLRANLP